MLSHNRDDHAKNFSFLMDKHGVWSVSPAYDLTFSYGPAGEHSSIVMGEGKNPKKNHLLMLAKIVDIKQEKALEIINQVSQAIKQWKTFAQHAGVSKLQTKNIGTILEQFMKQFFT